MREHDDPIWKEFFEEILGGISSDNSARRSYVEPSESSIRDAATKTCLWPCDDYMVRVGIKEEFEQYVHNAGLGPYLLDKCE